MLPLFRNRPLIPLVLWGTGVTYALVAGRAAQLVPVAGLINIIFLALTGTIALWLHVRINPRLSCSPIDFGLLLLAIAILVSSIFSEDPSRSWRMAWGWLADRH